MLKGIWPSSWLLDKSRDSNYCKLPILYGIFPLNKFDDKFRFISPICEYIFCGICPTNRLQDRSMLIKNMVFLLYPSTCPLITSDKVSLDRPTSEKHIGNAIRQPYDLFATVNRIFQRWILTPARELPLDLPDACNVTPPQPFERWI